MKQLLSAIDSALFPLLAIYSLGLTLTLGGSRSEAFTAVISSLTVPVLILVLLAITLNIANLAPFQDDKKRENILIGAFCVLVSIVLLIAFA